MDCCTGLVPVLGAKNICRLCDHRLGMKPQEVKVVLGGEIRGVDSMMVHTRMMLGSIVALVGRTRLPKVSELCLGGTAAESVESHVH